MASGSSLRWVKSLKLQSADHADPKHPAAPGMCERLMMTEELNSQPDVCWLGGLTELIRVAK